MPLHATRLRERGYNQALELARPISSRLDIPIDYQSCTRARATPAQSALSARERSANVKGAFQVSQPLTARHVAIIDDVMTTGHTADELARMLQKTGVERIDIWVCAVAPSNR